MVDKLIKNNSLAPEGWHFGRQINQEESLTAPEGRHYNPINYKIQTSICLYNRLQNRQAF